MFLKKILKAIKPFRLLTVLFSYGFGGGLVQYARGMVSWAAFIQGAIFLLLFTICLELTILLAHYGDINNIPEGMTLDQLKQLRTVYVMVIATLLTVAITFYIDWVVRGIIWQGILFLLFLLILIGAGYFASHRYNGLRPYQLFFELILFVITPPAFAFFLQSSESHRFMTIIVIGFVPAYLAYRLLEQLMQFLQDQKHGNKTLVIYVGWERAMVFHNALILLTYVLLAGSLLFKFPWFMLWPVFLSSPIGILEIWLMERVRQGHKPLWKVMQFATASVLFITIYLISFAFWIR